LHSKEGHLNLLLNEKGYKLLDEQRQQLAEANENAMQMASGFYLNNQKYWLDLIKYPNNISFSFWHTMHSFRRLNMEEGMHGMETAAGSIKAGQHYFVGLLKYLNDFMNPYWTALQSFIDLEKKKLKKHNSLETAVDYMELLRFNIQIADQCLKSTAKEFADFHSGESQKAYLTAVKAFYSQDAEILKDYALKLEKLTETVVYDYPEAIRAIEPDFGFHFDDGGYRKFSETDRFTVYQVFPRDKAVKVNMNAKPILIMHPYVLGPNILAFLPGEGKSYTHAFANQSIPTYIRILKDIHKTPAVQVMTGEDDAKDTRFFCEKLMAMHKRKVTLNGFCQGGFIAVLDILSGELDGLVDALITCVAPMDGTKSKSLVEYMEHLPPRFRDLNYALKPVQNGNRVVDGKVMSWVYKLKSMDKEAPVVNLYKDLKAFNPSDGREIRINKTAAALNYWLIYDRSDLPEGITKLSFDSYTIPVTDDGTLPVKMFGKAVNFKGIPERSIKWLLCYAEGDDLVDRDAALAPIQYIDVEVTPFPKGHGAIATSWSDYKTEYAINKTFGNGYRGPVRFQMDIDAGK